MFLQKKLFAEFLNRERKAFTSKCLEYTLSFHFFKKIVTYITLAKKGGDMICLIFKSTTNYPANVIQSLDDVKRQSRYV